MKRATLIAGLALAVGLVVMVRWASSRVPRDMVLIPAGAFVMGTDETDTQGRAVEFGIMKVWFEDEHPAHRVVLPAFEMDRDETTNTAYVAFLEDTGHSPPPHWLNGQPPAGLEQHPVVNVSWEDASAYCRWAGKRLPTEPEWEKAARGTDGRRYPWGDAFDPTRANVGGVTSGTTPVGSYPQGQSPEGVHDLIGNVWEWTADWYAPYPGGEARSEKFSRQVKVLRGSSFSTVGHYPAEIASLITAHNARAGFRLFFDALQRLNDVGFRCARSVG